MPTMRRKNTAIIGICFGALLVRSLAAEQVSSDRASQREAAILVNRLRLDLLRQLPDQGGNPVLAPYSLQIAVAMTYSGAAGQTRTEMRKTFDYPSREEDLHSSLRLLISAITALSKQGLNAESVGTSRDQVFSTATRLYGQQGFPYRPEFLSLLDTEYDAPISFVDFIRKWEEARQTINGWVAEQTQQKILDLVPPGGLESMTRLVIVNAVYLKVPWKQKFERQKTGPLPFLVHGASAELVPTMEETTSMGYANFQDFEVLAVPYAVPDLQFLIILPKVKTTVAQVERGMTAQMIAELAQLPSNRVRLFLPKFKIQPITLGLSAQLKALGMETAFHQGRADFRRIDSKRDLFVEEVFHRVFIVVDEQGTEAAAASAAVSGKTGRTL